MDKYAYRVSDALAAALHQHDQVCKDFYRDVLGPWEKAAGEINSLWRRTIGVDMECLGFSDPRPDKPPPDGLSRRKGREELIPARGAAGQPWRDDLALLRTRPRLSAVLKEFGVQIEIFRPDLHRFYVPGMLITDTASYIFWAVEYPNDNAHLTLVKLSEFYAAQEAHNTATMRGGL